MHFGSRPPLPYSTERLRRDLVEKRVICPGLPPARQQGSLGEMYWLRKHGQGELMDLYLMGSGRRQRAVHGDTRLIMFSLGCHHLAERGVLKWLGNRGAGNGGRCSIS